MRFLMLGRSVGLKKKKPKKKKSQEMSWNRRLGNPASLLWSLKTTRRKPKIDMAEKLADVIVELRSGFVYAVTMLIPQFKIII